ncbi:hypothetical protein CAPTEDRAFT_216456 [Capitella teleta]|uniref:G-protein coupled receptors family 1 profile domain-containing protein n=1 Tax=Capitella teleta TaxID=283909 RepID=R7TDV1_CAPTE|nr:hypothetical protein CAPTEDRAFT_216456 [Capitella teleta]|eukprot:ELT91928.1 hypothetical protein CAPTEDRAFT_216456 [Capitella teleta]
MTMESSTSGLPQNEAPNQIITDWTLKYIYFVIGSIGMTGNIFVIVVILSYKKMKNSLTNLFILNQSFGDATVALFLLLTTGIEDDGSLKEGLQDELFCRLWLTKMPLWGMLVSSTYNLTALTFERYTAVVHPIWHKNNFTKGKAFILMTLSWMVGPAFNMAYMTPTAGIQQDGSCTVYSLYPNTESQTAVGIITVIVQYIFPLMLLAFYYIRMWRVLRRKVSPISDKPEVNTVSGGARKKKPDSMARARSNIIKTLILVTVSFILCWTWNQVFYLLFNMGLINADFTSTFYHFTVVMVFCNCCMNPFIYMAKYEQFQRATKSLLRIKSTPSDSGFNHTVTENKST